MASRSFRIFDADLHHQYPSGAAIAKYLPEQTTSPYYNAGRAVPHVDGAYRLDAVPPQGGVPGSDPRFVVSDHLDRHQIEYAILSCGSVLGISLMHDVDRAAGLARATNDWTVQEWFSVDERFLGSITVSTSDPVQAADEIRRMGSDPRMMQVWRHRAALPAGRTRSCIPSMRRAWTWGYRSRFTRAVCAPRTSSPRASSSCTSTCAYRCCPTSPA